jgi:DNA mismatch endonuclease, patch repair protein
MDTLTKKERSARMARVRGKDTGPELAVRSLASRAGLRYKLHRKDLPGTPDLSFGPLQRAVFVHGCFWHRHRGCGRLPKSKLDFWLPKLEANAKRDTRNRRHLTKMGWRSMVIWECQLREPKKVGNRLKSFLGVTP